MGGDVIGATHEGDFAHAGFLEAWQQFLAIRLGAEGVDEDAAGDAAADGAFQSSDDPAAAGVSGEEVVEQVNVIASGQGDRV